MSIACETVEIQTKPSDQNPSGVVIINKSDLTNEHVLVNPVVAEVVAPGKTKKPASWKPAE